jgi:hypothetical protein
MQLDPSKKRECRERGYTPLEISQLFWWDERHRKVTLGCSTAWEWRFPVDPDDPDCFLPLDQGGVLPGPMPFTTAKYLSTSPPAR